ncbi:MAG: GTP 3',8-cyclase MoaA [Bacillota bacterium]|jgi:cyclic pyranopterin phosphate synthase
MLVDKYQRRINYLRISVTDKCNLRCRYCMPETGVEIKSHDGILRWEELLRMVQAFKDEGVDRVRITGGEPLVRKGLLSFIQDMNMLGFEEISLTTNGILLKKMAGELKESGISRINISLDSLDKEKYAWITRGGDIRKVFQGIDAAFQAGLEPVKLNVVVVKGFNDDEVMDLALLAKNQPLHVRFIELMPIGAGSIWGADSFVSTEETKKQIERLGSLVPAEIIGNGPAEKWRIDGFQGTVGFISAISQHICDRCNRVRLTADGRIYPCLHGTNYVSCFNALRNGDSQENIKRLIRQVMEIKPREHQLGSQGRMMNTIGG